MKNKQELVKGVMFLSSRGDGYLKVEELVKDLEVEPKDLNTALHGDTVEAILNSKGGQAKVTKIISRAKVGFSGTLVKGKSGFVVKADDHKMYADIAIDKNHVHNAKVGEKVYVEIASWENSKSLPKGSILKIFGKPGENNAEMHAIAMERGFDNTFSDAIEREAEKIKQIGIRAEDAKNRKDFRKILTFTIDPDDAKDFDDAISFREIEKGNNREEKRYEIGIHIADVSHYVKIGSEIDREARKRGTSVYLVDRTIPMLPEVLSNDLCSLVPNEDRLTMSAVFIIDQNADVKEEWYGRTIIHSKNRLTYEDAEKAIVDKKAPLHSELAILNSLAKKLATRRHEEGAISLEQDEVKFVLDENGSPLEVVKKVRGNSNKLIEEFMLLANRKVAKMMTKQTKKGVFLYRIHENPSKERMDKLVTFLHGLGYEPPLIDGVIPNKAINNLLKSLIGKDEEDAINRAIIRSMAKAVYSMKNIGHFGLAFDYYTHFTSPIRRYPDVVVHRIVNEFLAGKPVGKDKLKLYEEIALKASEREKYAAEAERASIKYKQVEYMAKHIGEVFTGTISGVTEWGIYVEELETKSEGMVRMKDIKGDFYNYNEKRLEIVGEKKKKRYRFGDRVQVKVKDVDLEKKNIDYVLV